MAVVDGRLKGARFVESPNQSERPASCHVDLLVIHNISLPPGRYGTGCIDQLFCNVLDPNSDPFFEQISDLKVSAHLLINREGTVTQYVPFEKKAWHAGQSVFGGRDNCNDYSIGIELEGTDFEDFTDSQYEVLVRVVKSLQQEYPQISLDRIVGHSDIAPGRKTDPGPFFSWSKLRNALSV
ncbi:MAG: 1,6-anhydro-N-acetylmuramyl-L-alanine amidase AmpD [Pseudohongiellaceae bacterium]